MKSVIQEASSLMKAIEKGWEKAGSPNEFTVKVLEQAERNFIGLTTKQAKVCILFGGHPQQQQPQRHPHAQQQRAQQERHTHETHAQQQRRAEPVAQQRRSQQQRPVDQVSAQTGETHAQQPGEQQPRRPRRRYYGRRPRSNNEQQNPANNKPESE